MTNKKFINLIALITVVLIVFSGIVYADIQVDTNMTATIGQAEELNRILNDLMFIYQIIQIQRQRFINAQAIECNLDEISEQQDIMRIVVKEIAAIKVRLDEYKKQKSIDANTESIKINSAILSMLLRELQALSKIIVVKSQVTEIACQVDKIYNLVFTATNIKDTSSTLSYTVNYDPDELEVIDLCSITAEAEQGTGEISGIGINVTQFDNQQGIIKFTMDKSIAQGLVWSGVVNGIKFKGKVNGNTVVKTKVD